MVAQLSGPSVLVESYPLFWVLEAPGMHTGYAQRHIQADAQTHKIKVNLKRKDKGGSQLLGETP